ncbi:hypothetical protein N0V95_002722 [Ascochyta clinopodiicola]|nr:hypothetical protein N0V95_002722 [Ascochyta clinopodiicola]
MLSEHRRYFEARSKKWDAGKKLDEKADEEAIMADLQLKVDEATKKLEESMRAVIDSSVAAQRIEDALEWLRQNAPKQLEEEYETQMTQRQTQRRQTQRAEEGSDAGSDADIQMTEGPTPGPTPLDGSRAVLTGSVEMFTDRMERKKNDYTSLSLTARYAKHNEYRDFKRVVHDARYGDDGPVLGHEDTWFTETGEPHLGVTQTRGGAFDDDDDDIVMDKATISTKCPITFQQFKEPYTSNKCPHTFEKNAILDMIRRSNSNFGRGGAKSVACPIPGCDQHLSAEDLRSDPILVRKIRRMQRAELEESQIDSDAEDDDEVQAPASSQMSGHGNSKIQVPSSQQPPQSSIIEDLGDPSDEEDDE